MNLRFLAACAVATVLGAGCTVSNPNAYSSCKTDRDCSGIAADICIGVTQNWSTGTVVDGICSTTCSDDFDCSLSHNGDRGYCSVGRTILGVSIASCFERCNYDTDCAGGFICGDAKQVSGLQSYERICIPEPGVVYVPPQYPYSSCQYDEDCQGSGTDYCVEFDPKWINQPGTFPLATCSSGCTFDTDCQASYNGDTGYCTDPDVISAGRVCMERCSASNECNTGYICTQMRDMAGFPNSTEGLCAPDPNP